MKRFTATPGFRRLARLAGCLGLLLALGDAAANPGIYKRGLQSVAFIIVLLDKKTHGEGSGSLVNEREKIVLTNYHVVGERDQVLVCFPAYSKNDLVTDPDEYFRDAKRWIKGKVVARSKAQDLALIQLESVPAGICALPLATRSPKPGETLHALGNSLGGGGALWRYSHGEVRQVYPTKFTTGRPPQSFEVRAKVVETQIPINEGDSGGPVLNARAELAAVNQGYHKPSRLVSYMIDISEVKSLLTRSKLMPRPRPEAAEKEAGKTRSPDGDGD